MIQGLQRALMSLSFGIPLRQGTELVPSRPFFAQIVLSIFAYLSFSKLSLSCYPNPTAKTDDFGNFCMYVSV